LRRLKPSRDRVVLSHAKLIKATPIPSGLSADEEKLATQYREVLANSAVAEAKSWRLLVHFGKTGDLVAVQKYAEARNSVSGSRAKIKQSLLAAFGLTDQTAVSR